MVIETRTRSPLGECYRSPLGALGPGVAVPEPPSSWVGNVYIEDTISLGNPPFDTTGAHYRDTGTQSGICGREITLSDDSYPWSSAARLEVRFDFNFDENWRQWYYWTVIGRTSGATWIVSAETQNLECDAQDIAGISQTVWSSDGHNGSLGFRPRYSVSAVRRDGQASWLHLYRAANDSGELGFIDGEAVDVVLPAPQVLSGTVAVRDTVSLHYTVDYDDCTVGTQFGNSNRLMLDIDVSSLRPYVTESDFMDWTVRGLTSGETFTMGQYASTYICGDWDVGFGSRRYAGGRAPEPGNVYRHEYTTFVRKQDAQTYEVHGNTAFGGQLPAMITGEAITVTEP